MLNWIWLFLILLSIVYAAFSGEMQAVSAAAFDGAKNAVNLVIGIGGPMIFFLGLMRVAQDGGLLTAIARGLRPILRRLFPDVPEDHPAMGAMVMNMASNILGLGNAATPFGLKAMAELDRLNDRPGVASNPMILFLAINTSAITLFPPTGTMAVRAAAGSSAPEAIWIPTLIATAGSTATAVAVYFLLRRLRPSASAARADEPGPERTPAAAAPDPPDAAPGVRPQPAGVGRWLLLGGFVAIVALGLATELRELAAQAGAATAAKEVLLAWMLPLLIATLLLIGVLGRVPVYESMVAGAREGLDIIVRIVPYLVAILAAIAMFRASGALDLLVAVVDPLTSRIGFPAEALPVALLRPLSGSGTFAVMSEVLTTYGPDSFIGLVSSTLMGSTETTFYVLALYLGAARVRDARFALAACLSGDVAGFLGATAACHLFFA